MYIYYFVKTLRKIAFQVKSEDCPPFFVICNSIKECKVLVIQDRPYNFSIMNFMDIIGVTKCSPTPGDSKNISGPAT